jgi:hypothetical protein
MNDRLDMALDSIELLVRTTLATISSDDARKLRQGLARIIYDSQRRAIGADNSSQVG